MITIQFELNGKAVSVDCPPERRLLELLRETFRLTAAKPGCGIGRCGACMVWVDEQPVNACLVMAWQLEGRRVRSYESLASSTESAPVREALARCGGLQCGYCTPGLAMTLTHLHRLEPRPNRDEATLLLTGNLCRCTGYGGIHRTVAQLFDPSIPASLDESAPT